MIASLVLLLILAVAALIWISVLYFKVKRAGVQAADKASFSLAEAQRRQVLLESELGKAKGIISRLEKWTVVADADEKARELIAVAQAQLRQAENDARVLVDNAEQQYKQLTADAKTDAKDLREQSLAALATATARATEIVQEADRKAEQIAGKAYDALRNADLYERTVKAMKNIIEGYGDEYLLPAESLIDQLAEEFSHKDAGQQLKLARDNTKALIKAGQASQCEYVEANRREGAERFVLDAFNGKTDSILTRVKHDNYGKLEQEIKDSFTIVNFGGKAFRKARIADAYLDARLSELKWACIALELKRQEQEEQRQIREQIREEEKARKEYERALRETAKEEELIRKAMEKAQAQAAAASDDQRAKYEAQLAELGARLQAAEEKGQRALSMAQQTRKGHVYVISNIGSFGEDVYKIGLTRRLEPQDRIDELGDSSVPFDFDVHAFILAEDAPALEHKLHKHFLMRQVNKINYRKEFFKASIAEIRTELESLGIEAKWTMSAEAREYRETQAIEKMIESDPVVRDAWINRQLTVDPVSYSELAVVGEEES